MTVIIYLHELRAARDQAVTLDYEETFPLEPEMGRLTQPVRGTLELQLNQDYLLIAGQIRGQAELVCDRCLRHFEQTLTAQIDEAIPLSTAGDVAVDKWTLSMVEVIGRQETVDITELVRQYTLLAVPPRRLCSSDCRPPQLATPAAPTIDPRLRKLAKLLPHQP